MNITFAEHDGCFSFELEATNMAEAAFLVRFGMNRTKEVRHASAEVWKTGSFTAILTFGKSKKANSNVPTRH